MHASDISIALGALIAALALVPMYFTIRQGDARDRREGWQRQIDDLRKDLHHERRRRKELEEENVRLMRKLLDRGDG